MNPTSKKPYGLILAGGYSRRMGQDKALLQYHAKPQLEHMHDLLLPFCEQVFVSLRADQSGLKYYQRFNQILDLDQYKNIGPLGGILSAMTDYPGQTWLIMACDLPYVTAATIEHLLKGRNSNAVATAYISTNDRLPEPLCALWEGAAISRTKDLLAQGIQCPRKVLIKAEAHLLEQLDPRWLFNVNSPEEFAQLKNS